MKKFTTLFLMLFVAGSIGFIGCDAAEDMKDGMEEAAGDAADAAGDAATDAADAVEETAGDAADAVEDAVDGDGH